MTPHETARFVQWLSFKIITAMVLRDYQHMPLSNLALICNGYNSLIFSNNSILDLIVAESASTYLNELLSIDITHFP